MLGFIKSLYFRALFRVSRVKVRVRVSLALVLGLMSSVCMTYSNVCVCVRVCNVGLLWLDV